MVLKILNLYAGIGGNRKLWGGDIKVTAVENNEEIAKIYHELYPLDEVIITDAHQYLLEHFKEFDFIWSSPPCPTHSRMRLLKNEQGAKMVYPDMNLYAEILLLREWFEGRYCVENVITYYDPLIIPQKSNNHYFWTNFPIKEDSAEKRGLIRTTMDDRIDYMQDDLGIDLSSFDISNSLKSKVLSNCVKPIIGLQIFNDAFQNIQLRLDEVKQSTPTT